MPGFPDDPSKLEVGFAFGADLSADPTTLTYTAVTSKVQPRVTITRGRIGDSTTTQPSTVDLSMINEDGEFSPRNITGPHYGQLRRNTPMRIRVDTGSGYVTRGYGVLPDWNPTWSGPDIDDKIRLQAAGVMRRLGQGSDDRSPLLRTTLADNAVQPYTYWPCEDPEGSATAANAVAGGAALPGAPIFRRGSAIVGSSGALDLTQIGVAAVTATVTLPNSNGFQIEYTCLTDIAVGISPVRLFFGNGELQDAVIPRADGLPRHRVMQFVPSGGDVLLTQYDDGVLLGTSTLVGFTVDTRLVIMITNDALGTITPDSVALVAHLTVFDAASINTPTARAFASRAFFGELASARVTRLCAENSIVADVTAGDSEPMGFQTAAGTLSLLRECEESDEATLLERRTGKLGFDPRSSRYDQAPALTLLYTTQVADLALNDDDRNLVNNVAVTRIGGGTSRYRITTGPLSTNPVTGSGDYPAAISRSLQTDLQALNHAALLANVGTVDEPRYVVYLNLRANTGLITQWLACDIGSRVVINSPPSIHTGPAPLDLIIEGDVEVLDAVEWSVAIWTQPYRPYEAYQIGTGTGNRSRIPPAGGGTNVNVQRSATDTSFAVTSTTVRWIDSAAFAAQFPILVEIAGEVMSCTAITGTTLAQTMTMIRGTHGTSKIIPAGSAVQLWRVPVTAL